MLSNKEVVDIVASVSSRSSAARALVESAVRAWRYKYPTSKVDDCAVVVLFLDSNMSTTSNTKSKEQKLNSLDEAENVGERKDLSDPTGLDRSGTVARPAKQNLQEGNKEKSCGCHENKEESSNSEEMKSEVGIEWSALEGVSRVNTLLTLPRFVPGKEDKKATGDRKFRK